MAHLTRNNFVDLDQYQFMRDLIACRDWYDRDSGCILSRDELCDIINFFGG